MKSPDLESLFDLSKSVECNQEAVKLLISIPLNNRNENASSVCPEYSLPEGLIIFIFSVN